MYERQDNDCHRHRLSAVEHADRIYVLEKGRVMGYGNHQELLRHNQSYQRLVEAQNYAEI